jgi:DNA helicase-2/ATP-dependent DNA helicase PcrA
MHSAKGKEFPKVWLPGLLDGTVPNKRSDDLEEERRLFYVAMTRAEDTLVLSFPWEVHTVGIDDVKRVSRRAPSRFLTMDLGIELKRDAVGSSENQLAQRRAS